MIYEVPSICRSLVEGGAEQHKLLALMLRLLLLGKTLTVLMEATRLERLPAGTFEYSNFFEKLSFNI